MNENILERAIAFVSPKTAAIRMQYRIALDRARIFDAAKMNRRTEGWISTGNSANAETGTGLDKIRYRARDLERNNGFAASVFRKFPAYLVGYGVQVRPSVDDKATKVTLRNNWRKFVRTSDIATNTNFDAQIALAVRTLVRDGEVLLVWHDMKDINAPLSVHVLEADYLDSLKTQVSGNNVIIQGVEYDTWGRRVAFWLFDQHPGEMVLGRPSDMTSKRVDAARVDHIFDILRPGQVRGIPWAAPIALRLRDVSEYEDAELIRKKIESCFSVFVTNAEGSAEGGRVGTHIETETGGTHSPARLKERITPGMINYLAPGEDVTFGTPRQMQGSSDYLKHNWYTAAAGMGMPYSMATGDVSNANYSSQREARLDFWALLDMWQWNMLAPMIYDRAWRRVNDAWGRLGQGPSEFDDAEYAFPKRPWVDPDKDGKATERDLRMGRLIWDEMAAEAGHDPEEHFERFMAWKPRVADAGFDFGGVKPAAAPAEDEELEEDEDADADTGAEDEAAPGGEPDEDEEDQDNAEAE